MVASVTLAKIGNAVEELKQTAVHFPEMVREGKLTILPACYDVDTGKAGLL